MNQHGLEKFFHGIIASEDVTHGKPNPEVFLKGASKLACNPMSAWFWKIVRMAYLQLRRQK